MYEKLPYYAYAELKAASGPESLPHYRQKVNRLLFRLVNHFRPDSLVEVGSGNGDAFRHLKAARASMYSVSLKGEDWQETLPRLKEELERMKTVDFLHIGHTPYYKEVFEVAFPYLHTGSCVVVGGIYESDPKGAWWELLKVDDRVRITFDLYDVGLLLFEDKRFKQNYMVNFF